MAERVQELLDPYCLLDIQINPESRVKVAPGPARPELVEQGWRSFLVKVRNDAGVTAQLQAVSPNAQSLFEGGGFTAVSDKYYRARRNDGNLAPADRWLDLAMFNSQPLRKNSAGSSSNTASIQLYSRDAGQREAKISSTSARARRTSASATKRTCSSLPPGPRGHLRSPRRERQQPTTAAFVIRDAQGRVYPSPAKRLAPDFAFHPQVYRADGETVKLPAGRLHDRILAAAPSTITQTTHRSRSPARPQDAEPSPSSAGSTRRNRLVVRRPPHPRRRLRPLHQPDRGRHRRRHDAPLPGRGPEGRLQSDLGPVLRLSRSSSSPAKIDKVSQYPYLLRYDVEVSGFGSHQSGHLVPAAPEGGDVSRRRFRQALADARPEHAALGQEAGRGLRPGPLRLGPGGRDARNCRTTSSRPTTASAPTSTSST